MTLTVADDTLCAVLRGDAVAWPAEAGADFAALFVTRAEYHGITALIDEKLMRLAAWPQPIRDAIHQRAVAHALWELRHQSLLAPLFAAFQRAGLETVLFKGTALAYGVYDNPVLRIRSDTDIVVAPTDFARAGDILTALGFAPDHGVAGEFLSYQKSFTHSAPDGSLHSIDLHRRINNSELLSKLFSFAELRAAATPLTTLGAGAHAAAPVHALLLACMHRATHVHNPYYVEGVAHFGGDRLIWYYDMHLLAASFTPADWRAFAARAADKGLCATCLACLNRATALFRTPWPEALRTALDRTGEPVADYLTAAALRQNWLDFRALPRFRDQMQYIREVVFPPAAYMRHKYATSTATPLPWLYARRALGGIAKRLR